MPPKPNYKFQRAERDRAKKAAKEAKLQERREQAAQQKPGDAADPEPTAPAVQSQGETP